SARAPLSALDQNQFRCTPAPRTSASVTSLRQPTAPAKQARGDSGSRRPLGRGLGQAHVSGALVIAQAQKYRLPQLPVRGPFLERDLGDEPGGEKDHPALSRGVDQGWPRPDQWLESPVQRG